MMADTFQMLQAKSAGLDGEKFGPEFSAPARSIEDYSGLDGPGRAARGSVERKITAFQLPGRVYPALSTQTILLMVACLLSLSEGAIQR
ncbi:MAG TPA: hypothetical protein VMW15_10930 [Terracidiphilus sp.]|jgi:hypothetical protein|nr:hypothetical protein [Terracidiphilus sp.]